MSTARTQRPTTSLTLRDRCKMVPLERRRLGDRGRIQQVPRRRHDRHEVAGPILEEGHDGVFDRSSRPKLSANATPPKCRRRIIELRMQLR